MDVFYRSIHTIRLASMGGTDALLFLLHSGPEQTFGCRSIWFAFLMGLYFEFGFPPLRICKCTLKCCIYTVSSVYFRCVCDLFYCSLRGLSKMQPCMLDSVNDAAIVGRYVIHTLTLTRALTETSAYSISYSNQKMVWKRNCNFFSWRCLV